MELWRKENITFELETGQTKNYNKDITSQMVSIVSNTILSCSQMVHYLLSLNLNDLISNFVLNFDSVMK